MRITRSSAPSRQLRHGVTTVGTTVQQLAPSGIAPASRGVWIRAAGSLDPSPNTDTVFIGGVEVTGSGETMGWPLAPSDTLYLEVDDPSLIFAISNTPGQSLSWLAF